ncbi:alpha-L-fucosidase [Flavobacterium sp. 90]|uniref:alpha-L-fucosidase n=1 Tax=unclassified Flavobacterium TaxID=196869 RepID=UPI000EAD2EC5|nr:MULTISPECIES: alpha-L-fucosidase [unclassified Flavobacterium]RKR12056.1 alpha-L-fucosidase [Flavobacterium sp. 81]TCK55828.1 alpha-L-fucosidase [Flavobacterium sp. 90]
MKKQLLTILGCFAFLSVTAQRIGPPDPYGALPTESQLRWQELEQYVLVHFTPTTFQNKEWGYGDADPKIFNPAKFDASQIVNAAKDGGFKGVIFVAKHHDGFCLWPTKTTSYNISKSPFRDGNGDMVKEFEIAARKAGMKFGLYCSPWDRNNEDYGKPEYVEKYRNQLRELYSNYGDLFITWFDGANGGDGYYGGKNEKRSIDRSTYYGWDKTWGISRELQPGAVIFADNGDVRWVGNERGFANETSWETFTPEPIAGKTVAVPGETDSDKAQGGTRNGKFWKPAECDVPLRNGWFYHANEDNSVKSVSELFEIYCKSVGRGAAMDIGISPNTDGLLHQNDVKALKDFGDFLKNLFADNLAQSAVITASEIRGENQIFFGTKNLTDNDRYSYWATNDDVKKAWLLLEWKKEQTFNIIRLRENIKLGQRIEKVEIDAFTNGIWKKIGEATSIGANRLVRLPNYVTTSKLRILIKESPVCIALSDIGVFREPEQLPIPKIKRDKDGNISITTETTVNQIHYTIDGTEPTEKSPVYEGVFSFLSSGNIKAKSFGTDMKSGETAIQSFNVCKKDWKIVSTSFENPEKEESPNVIDENPETFWSTADNTSLTPLPQFIVIDMGEEIEITTLSYLPRQMGTGGIVKNYQWEVSTDNINWTTIAAGEFANIKSNPVEQNITLKASAKARYIKFIGKTSVDGKYISIAELGVKTIK